MLKNCSLSYLFTLSTPSLVNIVFTCLNSEEKNDIHLVAHALSFLTS